jgi:hypothetical protein
MTVAYAALIVEGFDHYLIADLAPTKWQSVFGAAGSIGAGRVRGSCYTTGTDTGARQYFGHLAGSTANYDHLLVGTGFRPNNLGSVSTIFSFDSGASSTGSGPCDLVVTTSGILQFRRNGTVIDSAAAALVTGTWYYIEAKILVATTAVGSYEIRVNGVTVMGPTATVQTSSSTVNLFRLHNSAAANPNSGSYDDLVVQDWSVANVDFLGDVSVATLIPDGAGNYTQWTPLSSTNVSNVDDATADGDTTYNADATVGDKDSFSMGNLPSNGTPYIVQVTAEARKDDAGSRTLRNFLRVGGTDYEGTSKAVTDTYLMHSDVWNSDPSGGAWDQTKVDALEVGEKVHA